MPPERDDTRDDAATIPPEAAAVVSGASASADEAGGERGRQADIVGAANAAVHSTEHTGRSATSALPGVLSDVPVAVLVIDQNEGTVVYANTAAVELAGSVGLPLPIDEWGASAGLTDLTGAPLASTSSPLSEVAGGRPVVGEAVRLLPHRSSDADRADAADEVDGQTLWVTGFPLSQDGDGDRLALVVFLQVDAGASGDDPEAQLQALRDRAVVATDICFTITDPRQPDDPLVWVNPSFGRVTGYSYEDSVGRNCRFLQGPATSEASVAAIRAALREQRPITETLLNYRKDGTAFWNQLSISPVFDGQGELVSFVGVQTDVTERVRVEGEREAAFAAEQAARREAETAQAIAEQARADAERAQAEAEIAQSRLALMAEATSTLSATLEMTELLDRLAGLCVPLLADWVFITLVDPYGDVRETAARHRDGMAEELRQFSNLHAMHLPEGSPSRQALEGSKPVHVPEMTAERMGAIFTHPSTEALFRKLGGTSVLTVPMVARRRTLGAMALVMTSTDRAFAREDVELADDLSRRAALAMDNVRLYQQEHEVAETLQRSLLPQLPTIPRIASAAHYVSASTAADVGGDFYDLLQLPDGTIGIAIGDVVGHDVAAAAAMGHLRGLLRACVWEPTDPDPGAVLGRVDRLVQGLHVASMATMAYVRATPPEGEGRPWTLSVANAGHPPLLLRRPDGGVDVLDGVSGLLVGVDTGSSRESLHLEVPVGSTLLGYTDGLIEHPGADLDEGIATLVERLRAAPVGASPADLCDHAVAAELDRRDDVAVIAVRFD
ncbi:GAF domain-containing SpoIIE family protein phosphatase [Modestobacter sp. Leaf380]|uniref:GAF domain-containing SpoIIE family protein phosphatase n=1 Tax=Modestobacter sp. Leaf380 TaxID=1736356 RepID=UPI0006FA721C|nr:GAF domain-containing SpoIIE family protein phosphatase [Modestobacter sp. Leaf380]KQS67021.1 histidine kinase [Modestobacter sp. Leaf380]